MTITLQWHSGTKRWRKKIGGKDFYFKFGTGKADRQGHQQAVAACEAKMAELDARLTPDQRKAKAAVSRLVDVGQWYEMTGDSDNASRSRKAAETIRQNAKQGIFDNDVTTLPIGDADVIWRGRIETVRRLRGAQAKEGGFYAAVAELLYLKQRHAEGGLITPGRFDNLRGHLEIVKTLLGDFPMSKLNEDTVRRLHTELISRTEFSQTYAQNIFDAMRQFIRWAYETRRLPGEIPRNLKSSEWRFAERKGKKSKARTIFEVAEFNLFAGKVSPRFRLYLLLMLNCGFTQCDVAAVTPDEVDWSEGRIIKKRTKTQRHETVPVVNYRLWDETWTLFEKYANRKGELCFTTRTGKPLKVAEVRPNGTVHRKDCLQKYFDAYAARYGVADKTLKSIRKTGNTRLKASEFGGLRRHYLGHAPRDVAECHYDVDHHSFQPLFDKAVVWLGELFQFTTRRGRP